MAKTSAQLDREIAETLSGQKPTRLPWAIESFSDLNRQGFMKPLKARKAPKAPPPTIACDACLNWHRKGKHTATPEQRKANVAEAKARAKRDAEFNATQGRSHSTIGRHVALKPWPGSEVQSLLFDKQWTVPEAKDWARKHGYKHGKVHETEGYIRLRQFDPIAGTEKRTITFGQGIKAIIEQVK